jgi:hypothetical protein
MSRLSSFAGFSGGFGVVLSRTTFDVGSAAAAVLAGPTGDRAAGFARGGGTSWSWFAHQPSLSAGESSENEKSHATLCRDGWHMIDAGPTSKSYSTPTGAWRAANRTK